MGESRYMEPLQLAGRLIMENGGETVVLYAKRIQHYKEPADPYVYFS